MTDRALLTPPEELLAILMRRGVRFVVVGAFGAVFHGSPLPTQDVDVCPARDEANLTRLGSALLIDLLARWQRTGTPFASTLEEAEARLASEDILSFETTSGLLDVIFQPSGTGGYADLSRDAIRYEIGEVTVAVASLRDIIRSKEHAHRERDMQQLPTLRKLLERRASPPSSGG